MTWTCSECGAEFEDDRVGCEVCGRCICPRHTSKDGRCPSCPSKADYDPPQKPINVNHVSVDAEGRFALGYSVPLEDKENDDADDG